MKHWKSWILPLLAGTLAAGVVWQWPAQPMWQSAPQVGGLPVQDFTPDGRAVLAIWLKLEGHGHTRAVLKRFDTETGAMEEAEMQCTHPGSMKRIWPSPTGRLAIVGEGKHIKNGVGALEFSSGQCYLHDGLTGQRLLGPLPGMVRAGWPAFSPDERYVYGLRGNPEGGFEGLGGGMTFSSATGEIVYADGGGFVSPDGTTLAAFGPGGERDFKKMREFRIVELPAGKELKRVTLPAESKFTWFERWDGKRLHAVREEIEPGSKRVIHRRCFLDLWSDPVAASVDELAFRYADGADHSHFRDGPDWVAYFDNLPEQQGTLDVWLAKLQSALGFDAPRGPNTWNVRIIDRKSGAVRYRTPRPLRPTTLISPDGRRILSDLASREGFAMWDADPPPRWPWALAAGLGGGAAIELLRRWRRRNRKPAAAHRA